MYVCYDRTLHKFWVVVINSVYRSDVVTNIFCILNIFCTLNIFSKHNMNPTNYGTDQEKLWKKLVEFQAYNDRVMELLARLGNHIKIIFR